MDPVVGVIVGAAITAVIGFVAAVRGARDEHRKWLRAERLKAYLQLVEVAADATDDRVERVPLDHAVEHESKMRVLVARAAGQVQLLGPESIVGPAQRLEAAAVDILVNPGGRRPELAEPMRDFIAAAHRGLNARQ